MNLESPVAIPVIGLVGGIGSGKSYVARALAAHEPVAIIDADRIGHEVLTLQSVKPSSNRYSAPKSSSRQAKSIDVRLVDSSSVKMQNIVPADSNWNRLCIP